MSRGGRRGGLRFRHKELAGKVLSRALRHPLIGKAAVPAYVHAPKPFTAQISLTHRCQCACVHCSAEMYRERGYEEPSTDRVMRLIDELADTRAYKVYFFGGEPLLRPDLGALIAHASDRGFQTLLDTNGVALDGPTVARLADAGLTEIGVSLDSARAERHDGLRGLDGTFDRAVAGLRRCVDAGIGAYVATYATHDNLRDGDLQGVIDLAVDAGAQVRVLSPVVAGRWLDNDEVKLDDADVALLRALLREGEVFWESVACSTPDAPYICFSRIKGYVYVSVRGDVQPCNFIPISYGNAYEEPIRRIVERMWRSELFRGFDRTDNPSGCPMNDLGLKQRIQAAVGETGELPVDYRAL